MDYTMLFNIILFIIELWYPRQDISVSKKEVSWVIWQMDIACLEVKNINVGVISPF